MDAGGIVKYVLYYGAKGGGKTVSFSKHGIKQAAYEQGKQDGSRELHLVKLRELRRYSRELSPINGCWQDLPTIRTLVENIVEKQESVIKGMLQKVGIDPNKPYNDILWELRSKGLELECVYYGSNPTKKWYRLYDRDRHIIDEAIVGWSNNMEG